MIKEFIKIKNKAIVTTDENKILVTNCHRDLESTLNYTKKVQSIEKYIKFLNDKLEKDYIELPIKEDKNLLYFYSIIFGIIYLLLTATSLVLFGLSGFSIMIILDIIYANFVVKDIKKNNQIEKNLKKEIAGIELELEYLEKIYNESKIVLNEMIENNKKFEKVSTFYRSNEIEVVKLNEYDESIKTKSQFYYDLGSNAEEYCNYFMEGNLREKLQETHSEENIQRIEEYFQNFLNNPVIIEIGPILARKKKENNYRK